MSEKLKAWSLLLLLSLIWGSSFLLIKTGLYDVDGSPRLPADELGALRVAFATLFLSPLLFVSFKYLTKKTFIFLLISGICGNGLPAFLFAFAETRLNSSVVGMLNSLVPLFTILIGALFFQFKIKKQHIVGIVVATLGTFLIVREQISLIPIGEQSLLLPLLSVLVATLCYAVSLNVIKYKLVEVKSTAITSLSFFMISPFAFLYLYNSDFIERVQHQTNVMEGIGAILLLALVGTAMAVLLFNQLIKISSPVFASSVTYFIPIVAMSIGFFIGESITPMQVIGMFVLIGGVLIVNRG